MIDHSETPTVIILGAGPSGIATAHKLKWDLGFDNFLIYEKLPGPGGTWQVNRYPGCGCDIPSHLYSFSFNLNPNWSQDLVGQEEILQSSASDMNDTVDKFALREHMHFETECLGATWNNNTAKWEVQLRDVRTGRTFVAYGTVLISAVGAISFPKKVRFPGMDKFGGKVMHTAEWDLDYEYRGKRMAVIGNGCSAAQVIPSVVRDVAFLKQYARGAQWYHERPNTTFSWARMWAFNHIPLYNRWFRFRLFTMCDSLAGLYAAGEDAAKSREAVEEQAKAYIYGHTPSKYHGFIAPTFPLGCKRRIWDPGYLDSLSEANMELVPEGIREFDQTGIVSSNGTKDDFDVIVTATGFEVTNFLVPMDIVGSKGKNLREQWQDTRGAQAYYGCFVHDFPNFAMLFGPNTFPGHNSALFAIETSIEFVSKAMLAPILDHRLRVIDVKHAAEERFTNRTRTKLEQSVYEAGCSNWFVNEHGKNVTSWPGYAIEYYKETFFPRHGDFNSSPGSRMWPFFMMWRWLRTVWGYHKALGLVVLFGLLRGRGRSLFRLDGGGHIWRCLVGHLPWQSG
ncbi:hypothetical protein ACJ41O_013208 [Fusarium nematophilum]